MSAWDYPAVVVATAVAALLVAVVIMRAANPRKKQIVDFECSVCGRKQSGMNAQQWRYCPYCGAPKGGTLADLPSKKSVLDL